MKLFNVKQIRECDAYTIENEPIASIDLMERAAKGLFLFIKDNFKTNIPFNIFCGKGNNGGDGLALARIMLENNYNLIVYIVNFNDNSSNDYQINYERLNKLHPDKIVLINDVSSLPTINSSDIIIDAIFGTGLNKKIEKEYATLIKYLNKINSFKIAVDMPSGLWAENNKDNDYETVFKANITLTFQFPKLSFLFPENEKLVGDWFVIDINLSKEYIDKTENQHELITINEIKLLLTKRNKFSHKGDYGHGLFIGGSYGKIGAAVLSSKAALKTGIGLLTSYIPLVGYNILQISVPEAMVLTADNSNIITGSIDYPKYSAIAIGPGIGTHKDTAATLKVLIQNYQKPIIFDADALNILSENKTWLSFVPKNSIFTPHHNEFVRLFGNSKNSFERLVLQREMSIKYNVYIVYKGHYSCISSPNGKIYFNSTGNPGMSTAGSGDVLTGIILGMISQSENILTSLIKAVYLHGLAGDIAAEKHTQQCLIATDIIENIPEALKRISI